jgi:ornithine cyclodeaminase
VTQLFIDNFETKFESIANVDEILTQVDIITSVSTSKKATFNDDFIKMGFILLVWRQMHEISESALIKADHIFLNTNCGVLAETEDIFSPLEESVINKSDIDGELGQLINDEKIMMS